MKKPTCDCGGTCSLSCEVLYNFRPRAQAKKAARRVLERAAAVKANPSLRRLRPARAPRVEEPLADLAREIVSLTGDSFADVMANLKRGRSYEDLVPRRAS